MSMQGMIYLVLCFRNYNLEVVEWNKGEKKTWSKSLEKTPLWMIQARRDEGPMEFFGSGKEKGQLGVDLSH